VWLEVTVAGSSSLWSVWSWITELLVCGLVPLLILLLNVLVIAETRRLLAQQKQLTCSVRLVSTKTAANTTAAGLAAGPDADARHQVSIRLFVIIIIYSARQMHLHKEAWCRI